MFREFNDIFSYFAQSISRIFCEFKFFVLYSQSHFSVNSIIIIIFFTANFTNFYVNSSFLFCTASLIFSVNSKIIFLFLFFFFFLYCEFHEFSVNLIIFFLISYSQFHEFSVNSAIIFLTFFVLRILLFRDFREIVFFFCLVNFTSFP